MIFLMFPVGAYAIDVGERHDGQHGSGRDGTAGGHGEYFDEAEQKGRCDAQRGCGQLSCRPLYPSPPLALLPPVYHRTGWITTPAKTVLPPL